MACPLRGTIPTASHQHTRGEREGGATRTTLDDTAPLMLPNEITIASVTDRLYEPSTLFDTHAIVFGMFG